MTAHREDLAYLGTLPKARRPGDHRQAAPGYEHPLKRRIGQTFRNDRKHAGVTQEHPVRTIQAVELRMMGKTSFDHTYAVAYTVPGASEWIWVKTAHFNQWLRNAHRLSAVPAREPPAC